MHRRSPLLRQTTRALLRSAPLRLVVAFVCLFGAASSAQQPAAPDAAVQRLDQLGAAIAQAQAQVEASQRQLEELKAQLNMLRQQTLQRGTQNPALVGGTSEASASAPAVPVQGASARETPEQETSVQTTPMQETPVQEQQAMQGSEIATLDQEKVESDSKYPVKISGLILFNAFTNSAGVDLPATPTLALGGQGSTGASVRQTLFGIDARGPRLFGATSRANARVDFFGATSAGGYNNVGGLLRLRTLEAALTWQHTEAFATLERPLISPLTPTSLTAVAEPALAWSGNLWVWVPQAGARFTGDVGGSGLRARVEAALVDVPDPPTAPYAGVTSLAEASRRPGTELRLSLLGHEDEGGAYGSAQGSAQGGAQIGFGGYFSPHRLATGATFNSWAGTTDYRLPLGRYVQLSGSGYRGQALGGLGGGGYQDYAARLVGEGLQFRALEDVGGWSQVKYRAMQKLEFNTAFGIDNVFAGQLRPYAVANGSAYQNIARNRTVFSNAIFSPSSYLLFSFEYRYVLTAPVTGAPWAANVFGLAAGYRF